MKIPTLAQAEEFLAEAERRNPGPWVTHSCYVGKAAQAIAHQHPELDADAAYILGLLHDIGRRHGVTRMRHGLDGYNFLMESNYDDAARVALTHSYIAGDVEQVHGRWDGTENELAFVRDYIANAEFTKYDRLIQLSDSISLPTGHCLIEKRMVDEALRYGTNQYTVPRWKTFLKIKEDFEKKIGCSIYSLLPNVVENTFGFKP